jgi:hypothetical protein
MGAAFRLPLAVAIAALRDEAVSPLRAAIPMDLPLSSILPRND